MSTTAGSPHSTEEPGFPRRLDRVGERAVVSGSVEGSAITTGDNSPITITQSPSIYSLLPAAEVASHLRIVSRERRRLRRATLGLSPSQVEASFAVETPTPEALMQLPTGKIAVVTGTMGLGKSESAESWLMHCIELYESGGDAPLPLWLDARSITGSLSETILRELGSIDMLRQRGVNFVIDGLDEAPQRADQIMQEAHIFVTAWPKSRAVLTTRKSSGIPVESKVALPLWDEAEAFELIQRVTGVPHSIGYSWPPSMREAVRRPLFALLSALDVASNSGVSRSAGALINSTVVRALRGSSSLDPANLFSHLERLAVTSTRTGRSVRASAIGGERVARALLDTNLVVEANGSLRFVLPLFEQWFAAQALLGRQVEPSETFSSLAQFNSWKYVLAVAVGTGSAEDVDRIMTELCHVNPGAAGWVIKESISTWRSYGPYEELESLPSVEEVALRVRATYQTWETAIGPLSTAAGPVPPMPIESLTLGIKVQGRSISESWAFASDVAGPYVAFVPRMDEILRGQSTPWHGLRIGTASNDEGWVWRWTIESLVHDVERHLKSSLHNGTPVDGVVHRELFWSVCLELAGKRGSVLEQLPKGRLIEVIGLLLDGDPESDSLFTFGNKTLTATQLRAMKEQLSSMEGDSVRRPWPGRDAALGGWVWSGYTPERLLTLTREVYSGAIQAYREITSAMFPRFGDALGTLALMPVALRGTLDPRVQNDDWSGCPVLEYVFDPLGTPTHDGTRQGESAVEIELATPESPSLRWAADRETDPHYLRYRSYLAANPNVAAFAKHVRRGSVLRLWGPRPATLIALQWLWDDLKDLGWAKSQGPHELG